MKGENYRGPASGTGGPGSTKDAATLATGPAAAGVKVMNGTVATLRLDAVLALGFGLSRSRAVALVKGGLVEVNGCTVESPSRRLEQGDLIGLRERGRLEIAALTGESRKGRQCLKLKKFNK